MEEFIDKDIQIKLLKDSVKLLTEKNKELQEHLSKYTNPDRIKKYQDRNKDLIKEYHKEYYEKKKFKKNED
jgi:protein associated with RNAse G/E